MIIRSSNTLLLGSLLLTLPVGCSMISRLRGASPSGGSAGSSAATPGGSADNGNAAATIPESGPGPQSADEYYATLRDGLPSLYEPQRRPADVSTRVDGHRTCTVRQVRHLTGEWTDTSLGCAGENPVEVRPFRVPPVPAAWRDLMTDATGIGLTRDLIASGSVIVPAPNARWRNDGTDDETGLPERALEVHVYGRNIGVDYPGCGVQDLNAACEPDHSHIVTGFNVARYRLQEAQRLQQQSKRNACRVAAWQAWSFARDVAALRTDLQRSGDWKPGMHYVTRYDGTKDEPQIVRAVDETQRSAVDLFHRCGGQGEPPARANVEAGKLIEAVVDQRSRFACADVAEGAPNPNTNCPATGGVRRR